MSSAAASEPTPSSSPNGDRSQTDAELIEAAIDAITQVMPVGLGADQAGAAAGRFVRTALRQPGVLARRTADLAGEGLKILAGTSEIEPGRGDRRFADPTWQDNRVYRRIGQGYVAWSDSVRRLVDDLDLDDKSALRTELLARIVVDSAAPTNTLLGNPAALKRAAETKGRSLYDGLRHAAHDVRHNGGMPSMVDTRPFVAGETVATTPGAVVFRNAVLELIQYTPSTPKVFARPLLVLPPQINKYYILDLAPGRSLVEHIVGSGQQVFMVSWRNPTAEMRDWDLDTYVAAVLEAIDATLEITGARDLNMLGVCAGGITQAALLGHLAANGDRRVRSASFLVTILDWSVPSTVGTILSRPLAAAAGRRSQAAGVLDGDDLGRMFAWLRPSDLVWNYWVNNYLLGKNPPAFDVLSWNVDSTNLPAGLHADFLRLAVDNSMSEAGAVEVLDTPVDLGAVTCDAFVVGAVTDHITPWRACYETVNLLGGSVEFVLSSQGHIQALVNPAGNPKGRYHTNPVVVADPDEWLVDATEHSGSWWDHWTTWLADRGGRKVNARASLGSDADPAGTPAPGVYVLD